MQYTVFPSSALCSSLSLWPWIKWTWSCINTAANQNFPTTLTHSLEGGRDCQWFRHQYQVTGRWTDTFPAQGILFFFTLVRMPNGRKDSPDISWASRGTYHLELCSHHHPCLQRTISAALATVQEGGAQADGAMQHAAHPSAYFASQLSSPTDHPARLPTIIVKSSGHYDSQCRK